MCVFYRMRAALLLLLLVTLIKKTKPSKSGSDCTDWRYGNCVPSNGDCGPGFREGSCDQQTLRMKCKVPCKLKQLLGDGCKYRFTDWGECDQSTGLQTRTGTLKSKHIKQSYISVPKNFPPAPTCMKLP
uniref:Midkine n=1 Tax=Anabas testudineus TaxID=64144 RepID=A0A7N6A274_ANATE